MEPRESVKMITKTHPNTTEQKSESVCSFAAKLKRRETRVKNVQKCHVKTMMSRKGDKDLK